MDGDGNVAECIERHDLVLEGSGAFEPEGASVNEMGLPSTDIGATGERLNAALGTEFGENLNRFGTVGTQEVCFCCKSNQKSTWYPTEVGITRGDFVAEVEHEGRTGTVQVVDGQLTILQPCRIRFPLKIGLWWAEHALSRRENSDELIDEARIVHVFKGSSKLPAANGTEALSDGRPW